VFFGCGLLQCSLGDRIRRRLGSKFALRAEHIDCCKPQTLLRVICDRVIAVFFLGPAETMEGTATSLR